MRITLHDKVKFVHDEALGEQSRIVGANNLQTKIILMIASKLAEAEFEDFNILLDMLFSKDRSNVQRVTRQQFSDFIITDMAVPIHSKDLDIFMRNHETLCTR